MLKLSVDFWVGKKDPFFESVIINSNRYNDYFANKAVEYCRKVLKKPWPKAEKLISSSPMAAYNYSRYILKKRWIRGEKAIAKSSDASYFYSRFVLKGKFVAGEKAMATWSRIAYLYAKNVLKSRFKIAEKNIAKSAWSVLYAINILKKRWKKGEEEIMKYSHIVDFNKYIEMLKGKDRIDFHNKIIAERLSFNGDNTQPWSTPVAIKWLETYNANFVREK